MGRRKYRGVSKMDSNLRNIYYEAKPFICAGFGLYATSLHTLGGLGKMAGLVLVGCGIAILYMRARYRGLIR